MYDIPQELVDIVIDHLHNDKNALTASSLVCRSWLPRARYHLFSVTLVRHPNVNQFLALLEVPQSTIGQYVNHLQVKLARQMGLETIYHNNVVSRLTALRAVRRLELKRIDWASLKPDTESAFLSNFGDIVSLSLFQVEFTDSLYLIKVLSSFQFLEELYLQRITPSDVFSSRVAPFPAHLTASPYLRRVDILAMPMQRILEWLQRSTLPYLKVLRMEIRYGYYTLANSLLKSLGSGLQELRLKGLIRFPGTPYIDLRFNTCLRSLSIIPDPDWADPNFFDELISTLSTITSSEMKHLAFNFWATYQPTPWGLLARSLTSSQFSNLEQISIHFETAISSDINSIRQYMDIWEHRGILNITFSTKITFTQQV